MDTGLPVVDKSQVTSRIQEQVLKFQITMHPVLIMQALHRQDQLNGIKLSLVFAEMLHLHHHGGEHGSTHLNWGDKIEPILRLVDRSQLCQELRLS